MASLNCLEIKENTLSGMSDTDCTIISLQSDMLNDLNINTEITSVVVKYNHNGGEFTTLTVEKSDLVIDSLCTNCTDVVSYLLPISTHGIYNISLEANYTSCFAIALEEICYFAECGLRCEIANKIIEDLDTDLALKYQMLQTASYCNNVDCNSLLEYYNSLIEDLNTVSTSKCTTC